MASYISVPRDLSKVKTKVFMNLTKRQILCFGAGALILSVIGALYIMGRGKGWFAKKFIPRLIVDELPPPPEEPGLLEPIPLEEPWDEGEPPEEKQ